MKNTEFEKFFKLSSELFCISDTKGFFKVINPAFSHLLGYTEEELLSRPYMEFVHPEDSPITLQQANSLLEGNSVHLFENRYITKDGKLIWLSWSSSVLSDGLVYAIAKNITEQKEAEFSVMRSERKFRSLVQNGYEIISIIGPEGTYTYHSDSLFRLLGYYPHELIGKSALDIVHPDDIEKVVRATQKISSGDYVNNGIPYRVKTADGHYKWLESTATNMMNDPFIKGIVVNSRDVTEKVLLKEQLQRELNTRQKEIAVSVIHAQETERTRLGQELHDNINQVLTTVKLYNEICMNEERTNRTLLQRSVKQINYCIETLRDISRSLSTSNVLEVGLKGSIRDLVDSINTTKKIMIRLFIENLQEEQINPDLKVTIYRIVQEQLTNILKHAYADIAEIHLSGGTGNIYLQILDDGTGFNPGQKKKGIGLTNMSSRVEVFNGKMEISSAPGKGCELKVEFPVGNIKQGTQLR